MSNSFISALRYDINFVETNIDGIDYVILQDPFGIAKQNLMLSKEFFILLRSLNGAFTYEQLQQELENEELYKIIVDSLNFLDENGYLLSPKYFERLNEIIADYEQQPFRPMLTADTSYPSNSEEFLNFAQYYFQIDKSKKFDKIPTALILPHIDFSLGHLSCDVYSKGYSTIAGEDFDLFLILGTSHRSYSDYFMFSQKAYMTPLGLVECDLEILNELHKKVPSELTIDDFSHKFEHSIEFQVVLLKYFFRDRNFKILPILVGSPFEFIINKKFPDSNEKINKILDSLRETLYNSKRKVFYIASVDFAHIGRKFGDDFDAEIMLEQLRGEDAILIQSIEKADRHAYFSKIIQDEDKWKICGNSSIYALMQLVEPTYGKLIDYAIWDETATKSAVSFASIALFK